MYQGKRLEKILELLTEKGELSSKEMIDYFNVSKDTIRRDVSILAKEGKIQRAHGGILALDKGAGISSFNERLQDLSEEKEVIAQLALPFIKKDETCFLDVSTINLKLCQLLKLKTTIYSHSLDNAIVMSTNSEVDFHLLGGKFYPKNRFYYSINEVELLKDIVFDTVIIGAAGLKNGRVSFDDQEDAHLKKLILKQAKTKILVAETNKLEKTATYVIGNIEDFDYFITEKKPTNFNYISKNSKLKIIY